MVLLFALQVFLARTLGPDDFGTYGLVLAWVAVLAALSAFGAPTAMLRFVPEYVTRGDHRLLRGVIRSGLGLSLLFGLAIVLVATGVLITTGISQTPLGTPFLVGIWLIPLMALAETQSGISRAFGKPILSLAPLWVLRPILILLGVLFAATAFEMVEATQAIAITLGAIAVVTVSQYAIVRLNWSSTAERIASYDLDRWIRVAAPLGLTSIALLLAQRADLLIIGMFMSTTDVGLYEAASRTALLGNFVLAAVNFLAAPTFASLHTSGDMETLAKTARAAAKLAFWPTVPVVFVLVAFGEQLLSLFGEAFVAVRWELAVLACAQLFGAAVGSVGYLLNVTGNQHDTLRTLLITGLANIVLNVVAIPIWGLLGAAIVTALTTVVWNLWLHALVKRRLQIRPAVFSRPVF